MTIDLELVGQTIGPLTYRYTWKDTVLYALGVGARCSELDFLLETRGPRVLPTFAVVPSFECLVAVCGRLGASLTDILHGEQSVVQHRPIPPAAELASTARIAAIYDKGKGALVVVEARTTDAQGSPLFDNVFSLFVRGAGGFGGDRGPDTPRAAPPAERPPDFRVSEATSAEQAALYRLSGDLNPLHIDPEVARLAGYERPILHGLCTFGHAGRALLQAACGGDPARFRSLTARFAGVVFPGDTLTTAGWQVEPGRFVLQVTTQDDRVVLSHSMAEITP
jgi:acyl dehydratase